MFKTVYKYILLLAFSGYLYVCLEIIWRGHTDVSMMFCASVCAIPMIMLNNVLTYEVDFLLQIIICMLFSTATEWITGLLVNFDHQIWDYTGMWGASPDGQVCVPYMLLWAVISALIIPLMDYIDWRVFDYKPETPPYYKIGNRVIFSFKERSD